MTDPVVLWTPPELRALRRAQAKLARLGGLARAKALTPARRSEIARIAVTARIAQRAARLAVQAAPDPAITVL